MATVDELVATGDDTSKGETKSRLKNRTKGGCEVSAEENLAIPIAWITESKDAIIGIEQKGDAFFREIHEE